MKGKIGSKYTAEKNDVSISQHYINSVTINVVAVTTTDQLCTETFR
jgi:hypothetical protein